MSDKRKSMSSNLPSVQPHPHRNSPQPPPHSNEFKPIALKSSSLSITPQTPTSPTLSTGPSRRHTAASVRSPTNEIQSNVDQFRQGYDESKAEDASEIDTAGLEIVPNGDELKNSRTSASKDDPALTSMVSDHPEDAKTLNGLDTSNDRKSMEEKDGLGVRMKTARSSKNTKYQGKRRSVFSKSILFDFNTEAGVGGRINRIRKKRVFMRADPKAYFSSERTTYSWMYLHILTLSFGLSLYAFPQATGQAFPPTHVAATVASGVSLFLVLATATQFRRRQQQLVQLSKEGNEKSAEVFDERVHRFPTVVTVFVLTVMVINIVCIWFTPLYKMKKRAAFGGG